MSWRDHFHESEGIDTCDICVKRKPLFANRRGFRECHDCWLDRFRCLDCDVNTRQLDEYYSLHHHVWQAINPRISGMLCIGCVEKRMGRLLSSDDFDLNVPINMLCNNAEWPKSERLIDRILRN